MPFQLTHELRPTNIQGRLENLQRETSDEWIVWWYGGIERSNTAGSQPKVKVAFRKYKDGQLFDIFHRNIGISFLGMARIGSLFKHGIPRQEIVFKKQDFTLDFNPEKWRTSSFERMATERDRPPYPQEIHPLLFSRDKSQLLEFTLPSGGRLVIPCIEFFSRCYGRSQELKKVLASYPWTGGTDSVTERLYRPLGEPEEPDKWKVSRGPRLSRTDSVFLAHAKYDPYTTRAAKMIYAQIESGFVSEEAESSFIKVEPWFRGPASIRAEGIEFNSGESFLGLRILGCSDPAGVGIESFQITRQRSDVQATEADQTDSWGGVTVRKLHKPPAVVDLTDEADPAYDTAQIVLQDPEFTILGEQRLVTFPQRENSAPLGRQSLKDSEAMLFSTGDPQGGGTGLVGYASIKAPQAVESEGALRDVWNALIVLLAEHPHSITSLSWFGHAGGFQETKEPTLVGLSPFRTSDNIRSDIRSWPYLDLRSRTRCRGFLLARLSGRFGNVYLIEIERRSPNSGEEESFRGFAFKLDKDDDLHNWLIKFRAAVRNVKGVVQRLVAACPGTAVTFNHRKTVDEGAAVYIQAVRNALRKLGVNLSLKDEEKP